MNDTIIFAAAAQPFPLFQTIAIVAMPIVLISYTILLHQGKAPKQVGQTQKQAEISSTALASISVFIAFVLFTTTIGHYQKCQTPINAPEVQTTEGIITEFQAGIHTRPAQDERFTVNNRTFSYGPYNNASCLKQLQRDGGPIREGRHVYIYHVGNIILRIDEQVTGDM